MKKISYRPLWVTLAERDMKKKDLMQAANITPATVSLLSRNESVTTATLLKIINALHIELNQIMELVGDNTNE